MTPDQFDAAAKLLRLRIGPAQVAAKLVLVDGMRPTEAAREAGTSRQTLNGTLRAIREGLELARAATS